MELPPNIFFSMQRIRIHIRHYCCYGWCWGSFDSNMRACSVCVCVYGAPFSTSPYLYSSLVRPPARLPAQSLSFQKDPLLCSCHGFLISCIKSIFIFAAPATTVTIATAVYFVVSTFSVLCYFFHFFFLFSFRNARRYRTKRANIYTYICEEYCTLVEINQRTPADFVFFSLPSK